MFEGLDDAYPLTPLQQGMLYESLKCPDSDVYVAYIVIDLQPALDHDRLQTAWLRTLQRHQTLRTRFIWEGLDDPLQLVESNARLNWTVCSSPSFEAKFQSNRSDVIVDYWLAYERRLSLSISDSPPMRLRLIELQNGGQVLIWTVHHLLADDWSTPLVLKSVAEFYDAGNDDLDSLPSQKEPLTYNRYVDWLANRDSQNSIAWWKKKLRTARPTPLMLGAENRDPSATSSDQHQRVCRSLSFEQSSALVQISVSIGCTLSTLTHAAWAIVVARFAGEKSALFGTSVSGRSADLPAIEDAVGLFLHTLPTQVSISDDEFIDQYLLRVQEQLFEQIEHEHVDLPVLNKFISTEPGVEAFETVLVVESHGPDLSIDIAAETASLSNIRYITDSNFPLTVLVFPGERIQIHLVGPSSRFLHSELQQVCDEFIAVIADLCSPEVKTVGELAKLQEKRMEEQYFYSSLAVPPSHETIDKWIISTGKKALAKIAVIDEDIEYTYQQLLSDAQTVALKIREHSKLASFVGIYLDQGYMQIASILGVLISGKAYVPLDCAWPDDRVAAIAYDAGIELVITNNEEGGCIALPEIDALDVNACVGLDSVLAAHSIPTLNDRSIKDPAYMIYTSGSTGRPKGISISHANLIYSTAARIDWYRESPQRYLLLSSFSFDSSVAGIFWTLCSGGTLVLPARAQDKEVHELEEQIYRHRITHTLCLPSLYMLLLRYSAVERLASLSCVIVAGEACPTSLITTHHEKLHNTRLFNEYGPTEATVWSTVSLLSGGMQKFNVGVPIGYSIAGSRTRVVDSYGRILPKGISGELRICGPGVASGYHGDPELSGQKFKPSTDSYTAICDGVINYLSGDRGMLGSDGQLYFLGRTDRQLKIRGYRVEAGEIESRMLANSCVKEAFCCLQAVGVSSRNTNNQRLVCFYTLAAIPEPNESCALLDSTTLVSQRETVEQEAQNLIKRELPAQFEVYAFAAVNVLARLPNGKIDESGFPRLTSTLDTSQAVESFRRAEYDRDPTFVNLCQVLSQLLCVEQVQPSDNFFSLGGDSLAAIRFVAASRERGLMLTIPMISSYSTIAELSDALRQNELAQGEIQGVEQRKTGVSKHGEEQVSRQAIERNQTDSSASTGGVVLEDVGLTPLSPVQRWFMSLNLVCPAHWNMAFVINLATAAPYDKVCVAIHDSLKANPVLSSQFVLSDGSKMVRIEELSDHTKCIDRWSDDDTPMEIRLALLQQEFNLQTGQLIRFSVGYDSIGVCNQIGVVVHHLVTDAISNWQLAKEITKRLDSINDSESAPMGSLSYRDWSIQIAEIWPERREAATRIAGGVQQKYRTNVCFEENVVEHRLIIDSTLWRSMRDSAATQNATLPELCLYVILQSWQRQVSIRVDVETHGRDLANVHGDTSATIGWFTAFFKLLIDADHLENISCFSQHFRDTKKSGCQEFLKSPENFFDHTDLLLGDDCTANILFNYLAFDHDVRATTGFNSGFTLTPLIDERFRDRQSSRSHAVEVIVLDGIDGVSVLWRTDRSMQNSAGIESWVAAVQSALYELSQMDSSFEEQKLSEQFPDSGLNDKELEQFLSSFD